MDSVVQTPAKIANVLKSTVGAVGVQWNFRAFSSVSANYVRVEIRFRIAEAKNWNFAGRVEMSVEAWNNFEPRFPDKALIAEI